MAHEVLVQDKLVTLYETLKEEKVPEQNFNQVLKRYVRPTSRDLFLRFGPTSQVFHSEVLADNTAGIALSNFSVESLKDIQNKSDRWFTLQKKLKKDTPESVVENYKKWASENEKLLEAFINNSDYITSLPTDKFIYDSFGFSAMTFGHDEHGLITYVEDPFMLLIVKSNNRIVGCMWSRNYKEDEMLREFDWKNPDYKEEEAKKSAERSSVSYKVIFATVPNNDVYINKPMKNKGKFVQVAVLVSSHYKLDSEIGDVEDFRNDDTLGGEEIGQRKHFNMLPTVIPTDSSFPNEKYGYGRGKWVLSAAANCNRLSKNIMSSSTIKSRPPLEAPATLFMGQGYVEPGRVYLKPDQMSGGGAHDSIRFIEFKDDLQHQTAVLQDERAQVRSAIPAVDVGQKKQRQSQYEIEKMELEKMTTLFAYKVPYLAKGVAEHLKRIFHIARDRGIFTDLPQGVDWDDIEPGIENIIEVEKMKIKAQKYVVFAQMAQPYFNNFMEGWDNIKKDSAIRNIALSHGIGSDLNDIDTRSKIREERRKMQQQQQQLERQAIVSQRNLNDAKAAEARGKSAEAATEAEQNQEGGP